MQTQNTAADSSASPSTALPTNGVVTNSNVINGNVVNGDAVNGTMPGPTCTACGEENLSGSRFCRHCGATIAAVPATAIPTASVVAPTGVAPTAVAPTGVVSAPVATTATIAPAAATDAGDAERARQLLDHSFMLAERGDVSGALVAARQSIALAPQVPQGYSMLGLLLERSGDTALALAAYQKVLQLAPGSRLEQESAQRLQAVLMQRQGAPALPADTTLAPVAVIAASNSPVVASGAAPALTPFDPAPTGLATTAVASTLGNAPMPATRTTGSNLSTSAINFGVAAPAQPVWKRIAAQPSFYFRGVPLVAATAFGLMWMVWARSAAPVPTSSTIVNNDQVVSESSNVGAATTSPDAAGENAGTAPLPGAGTAGAGTAGAGAASGAVDANGFPVQNRNLPGARRGAAGQPASGQQPGSRASGNNAAGRNNGRTNNQTGGQTRRPLEERPSFASPILPRPVPPASPRSLPTYQNVPDAPFDNSGSNGSVPSLPPVNTNSDIGPSSSGGSPLNPAGSGNGNYISVGRARPNTATPPVRPANRAAAAERNAANDLRNGRPDRAIENLTPNLEGGGETGWRYQQRALAFLERGDNQRAADDFQTAISAYRDQIRRGERVPEARAGITACQSGLRLALTNMRR